MLVEDLVNFINDERERFFSPSSWICIDESILHWYGSGGDWINEGLPMHVAIDRKPENGCKIQNACDGESGIMIRLKLVKTSGADSTDPSMQSDLNHGTKVLAYLVHPWACSMRTVMADSYFASVQSAQFLCKLGLRFIRVVKTATKGFPENKLQAAQFNNCGDHFAYYDEGNQIVDDLCLLAMLWVDHEQRSFISSTSNLCQAPPIARC